MIFNERHLRRVLSSYVGYYQGTRTLFGSTRIAPTHARLCHARSERWSLYRKSAACIIATNVSPPDSYRISAHNGCVTSVRRRLTISVSELSGSRPGADRFDIQIAARFASSNQFDSNSRSPQIPVQIRFLVEIGGLRLLSDTEPYREGRFQLQPFPESADLPGRVPFACGMEGHSKASRTLARAVRVRHGRTLQSFPDSRSLQKPSVGTPCRS